jgi:hypothetical protein
MLAKLEEDDTLRPDIDIQKIIMGRFLRGHSRFTESLTPIRSRCLCCCFTYLQGIGHI